MTNENWNHGCLLPCSKTWLSAVRLITNGRSFFRGRFRGRLIKIDAHRPSQLLAVGLISFTLLWHVLRIAALPHLQRLLTGTSKRFTGPALKGQGLLFSYRISSLTRPELKLTVRHQQPMFFVSHNAKELCPQFGKHGFKHSPVVGTCSEMAQTKLPGSQKSRDKLDSWRLSKSCNLIVTKHLKYLLRLLEAPVPTESRGLGPELPNPLCCVRLQMKPTALSISNPNVWFSWCVL